MSSLEELFESLVGSKSNRRVRTASRVRVVALSPVVTDSTGALSSPRQLSASRPIQGAITKK